MHTFEFLTYKTEYPSKWNELTKEQLLLVAFLMSKKYPVEKFNIYLLKRFLKIKKQDFVKINGPEMNTLAESIQFIHDTKELTFNLLPELKVRKGFKKYTLKGPANGMVNLTFEQFFNHCEGALNHYSETNDINSLNYLVASLYTFGEQFKTDDINSIQKLVKKLHIKYKLAVLLFYLGCKDFYAYKFPELFKTSKKKANISQSDLYFVELTDQLNNGNLSNNSNIKNSNILEAFQRLSNMIKEAEKRKTINKRKK